MTFILFTFMLTLRCFSWTGDARQFSVPYTQITLHAISKDPQNAASGDQNATVVFPHPHLLLMIDGDRLWNSDPVHSSSDGPVGTEEKMAVDGDEVRVIDTNGIDNGDAGVVNDDEDGSESDGRASDCPGVTTILRFVPANPSVLEGMYTALAECQALNPDLQDELSNSELEDLAEEGDEDEEEEEETGNGHNGLASDPGQFADC
ncbi:Nucleotide-sensitive chloride current inducer [Fasciola hepatica]|uniref:Nucleotide-sensitive chloride current inducer n=1 Tax=Fasciola hepatica TaxID=6192 RepID=A0A4E0RW71_FASHE|nr:Nucleotide-sensitive chloride current inducer [Fasciola hepatica]